MVQGTATYTVQDHVAVPRGTATYCAVGLHKHSRPALMLSHHKGQLQRLLEVNIMQGFTVRGIY
jgi:hypothetical protein